jgi:hypothetical protein
VPIVESKSPASSQEKITTGLTEPKSVFTPEQIDRQKLNNYRAAQGWDKLPDLLPDGTEEYGGKPTDGEVDLIAAESARKNNDRRAQAARRLAEFSPDDILPDFSAADATAAAIEIERGVGTLSEALGQMSKANDLWETGEQSKREAAAIFPNVMSGDVIEKVRAKIKEEVKEAGKIQRGNAEREFKKRFSSADEKLDATYRKWKAALEVAPEPAALLNVLSYKHSLAARIQAAALVEHATYSDLKTLGNLAVATKDYGLAAALQTKLQSMKKSERPFDASELSEKLCGDLHFTISVAHRRAEIALKRLGFAKVSLSGQAISPQARIALGIEESELTKDIERANEIAQAGGL